MGERGAGPEEAEVKPAMLSGLAAGAEKRRN